VKRGGEDGVRVGRLQGPPLGSSTRLKNPKQGCKGEGYEPTRMSGGKKGKSRAAELWREGRRGEGRLFLLRERRIPCKENTVKNTAFEGSAFP